MKPSTLLTTTSFLAGTNASTVLLSTTKCLDPSYPLTQFSIALNTPNAVPVSLPTVCGLRIVSASDAIDVHTIQCQAFRDAAGTQPGSLVFTYDKPALIATNPVQENAVKCSVVAASPTATASAGVYRRQDNSTASTPVLSWSSSFNVVRSTLFSTQTVSVSESSVVPSTLVQTTVVTASSSAVPSSSSSVQGSSSVPSATMQPPATQTNAAEKMGLSVGLMGAAFAALML